MKLTQEQKDLLIGILETTQNDLDIQESMEFGEDIIVLLDYANDIKVDNGSDEE